MNERDIKILHAARDRFARYGYGKTTMNDIAAAAGVTRQTVYNAYPGKTELMQAVVRQTMAESMHAVQTAWDSAPDVGIDFDNLIL